MRPKDLTYHVRFAELRLDRKTGKRRLVTVTKELSSISDFRDWTNKMESTGRKLVPHNSSIKLSEYQTWVK